MAARYWRVIGLDTVDADTLEITELQLWSRSARLDGSVSLTCTATPTSGSLSALQDGSLSGAVSFARAKYSVPGFALVWDFGADAAVEVVRIGAATSASKFPCQFALQSSSDGSAWTTRAFTKGVAYPGNNTLSTYDTVAPATGDKVFMRFEGADGSTTFVDDCGHTFTGVGSPVISTSDPLDGSSSLSLDGSSYLTSDPHADFNIGDGAFFISLSLQFADSTPKHGLVGRGSTTYYLPFEWHLFHSESKFWFYFGVRGNWARNYAFENPVSLVPGVRYRLTAGRDEDGIFRLYVDGLQSTTTVNDNYNFAETGSPNLPLFIGHFIDADIPNFNGKIDDLIIHKGSGPSTAYQLAARGPITGATPIIRADPIVPNAVVSKVLPPSSVSLVPRVNVIRAVDVEFGGKGRIAGTLKITGSPNTPTHRRLRLYRDRDGAFIRETWSDGSTGAYSFSEINQNYKYTVMALDYRNDYRAVVASNITPDTMT